MNTDRPGETDPLTGAILKAAFEVSNVLGHGFLEAIYQRALAHELRLAGLKVQREVPFRVSYKGEEMGTYMADLVVEETVVVELKCVNGPLLPAHLSQCLNYLRVSGLKTGLVLNFGTPRVECKRVSH